MATTREEPTSCWTSSRTTGLDEARMALALLNVPEVDEPLTEEELESIREGRAAYARGEYVTNDELKRRMGW